MNEECIEVPNIKELLELVSQAAKGKDHIKKGAVGYGGYGFVFKNSDSRIPYIIGFGSSKFAGAGSMRDVVKTFKKLSDSSQKFELQDLMTQQEELDLLLAGSLKTLIPGLRFGGDEILFNSWMLAKTPDDKIFPATFYYGASGMSVGGWQGYDSKNDYLLEKFKTETGKELFPEDFVSVFNFSPFKFKKEELNLFLDALEFALKKIPVSDFEGIYRHDLGNSHMGIIDGKPFIY